MAVWRSRTAPPVTTMLLLPMLLALLLAGFTTSYPSARSGKPPVKMEVFTEADLARAIARSNADKVLVIAKVNRGIRLTRSLPKLARGARMSLVGGCLGSGRKPARCVIDGSNTFSVFVAVNNSCSVSLRGLKFQHVLNGVLQGYCSFTARNCVFTNNRANGIGGAVMNTGNFEQDQSPPTVRIRYCKFTKNIAFAPNADGGAILMTASVTMDIAFSSFRENRAENGMGGAIAGSFGAREGTISLRSVEFVHNLAGRSGGAIGTWVKNLYSYNSTFAANIAGRFGGAISVEGEDILFCKNTFKDNQSPADNSKSANIFQFYDNSGDLRFCPGVPKSGIRSRTTNGDYEYDTDHARMDCTGCSGCMSDCNGNGKCITKMDFISTCKCNEGYGPTYWNPGQCADCLPFRNITMQCKTCFAGFVPGGKGKGCLACPGLEKIPYIETIDQYGDSFKTKCADKCSEKFRMSQKNGFWNVWAYIDNNAPTAACRGICVFFYSNTIPYYKSTPLCESDRKIHHMAKYGLAYFGDSESDVCNFSLY